MDQEVIEQADLRQGAWLETVCAFANGRGGLLMVQVPETRRRKTPLETLEMLPVRIYEELGVTCEVNLVMAGGRMGIEVTVPPSPLPVSCEGRFFLRRGGQTTLLTGTDLVRFLRSRDEGDEAPWERRPALGTRLEDLDAATVRALAKAAPAGEDVEAARGGWNDGWGLDDDPAQDALAQLAARGLADEATGLPNHGGALVAHRAPDEVIEGALVVIGFFDDGLAGAEGSRRASGPTRRREVRGPVLSQADQVVEEVLGPPAAGSPSPVVSGTLPRAALREAVLNALVHKDYAAGAPVQVSVYPDRVSIANVGRPPRSWDVDDLMAPHSARPANPAVARALAALGAVSGWGRGIGLMTEACAQAGLPEPRFILGADETTVTLPLVPAPVDPYADLRLSRTDRQLLALLGEMDRPTAAELAAALAVSDSTVRRSLKRLTQLGLIERRGSTKTGFWRVLS